MTLQRRKKKKCVLCIVRHPGPHSQLFIAVNCYNSSILLLIISSLWLCLIYKLNLTTCIFAWKIPWTEEPGRLQSTELQRVRHDWVTHTHTHTHRGMCVQGKTQSILGPVLSKASTGGLGHIPGKWSISCPASEQGRHSHQWLVTLGEGEERLRSSSQQTAATPYGEPWGSSGCENTGPWPDGWDAY